MAGINHLDLCPACGGSGASIRPLPMGARTAVVLAMFAEARDLPDPASIDIGGVWQGRDMLTVTLHFDHALASYAAITQWAIRFGGTVQARTKQGDDGPERWVDTEFTWDEMHVRAFAHIPLPDPDPEAVQHAEYPHEPGRLYGCPACESRCHCTPGDAECVYDGPHTPPPF
jgi:hypothetical protein